MGDVVITLAMLCVACVLCGTFTTAVKHGDKALYILGVAIGYVVALPLVIIKAVKERA